MKKHIAFLLTLALTMSLSACRRSKQPDTNPTTQPAKVTEATKPAESKTLSGTMEENINKIIAENPVEFMGGVIPLDLSDASEDALLAFESYTGLATRDLIKDGDVYEPMMGSLAFS